jgi:hypothetical protein
VDHPFIILLQSGNPSSTLLRIGQTGLQAQVQAAVVPNLLHFEFVNVFRSLKVSENGRFYEVR